ncbi:MAG: gliding motility-associated C-terminal domain-containing protein, partial [Bacteroidota bacterium]
APTTSQTICINNPITNITYATTGATGASFTGLPSGLSGSWASNIVTISGTPLSSGTFNYNVSLTGGCTGGSNTTNGTVTVNSNNFISLTSSFGSNNQTSCVNATINPITYSITGATGATFSGLPIGVTGSYSSNTASINGSPNVAGAYVYTVTSTGGCGSTIATGTINVNPSPPVNVVVSTLNSGLIGWYPFSGNANDFSGNNFNGTVSGASLTTDRFGNTNKAYSFSGLPGNQISIAHNSSLNSYPLTVSAWYKSGTSFDGGDIFSKYLNASWNGWECALSGTGELVPHYLINNTPCNGIIQGYTGCGNTSGFNYPGPTNDGSWHHVVFRVDGTGGVLYVDGQQVGQHPWIGSPTPVTTTAPLLIGPEFEGSIDDIGIWNRALTTDEIGYLYNTGSASICNGSSISISGSGANNYSWNTGANTQSISVNPTSNTTYTVTGTTATGCSSTNTFTVNVLPLIIPSVSVTPSATTICLGDSINFTASPTNGGTTPTYQWKINGVNVAGATGSSFSSTTLNNNDVVTVQLNSNATPCLSGNPTTSSPVTIAVNQPAVPSVSISSSAPLVCQGSQVTFTATPTTGTVTPTYTWLLNGSTISGATSSTYSTNTLNSGDSISVLINLNQGCFTSYASSSNPIATTISSGLNASISGTNNICYGLSNGFIDATTSGGVAPYTYQWSNGATTEDQSGLTAGTYSVTITDAAGCVFNSNFLIYQPPSPLSISNNATNISCFGFNNGSIDITVAGGYGQYMYFWSNGSNIEDQTQLSAGTYSVTIEDYNGCTITNNAIIIEPQPISTSFNVITTPCVNDSTGAIDLTVTGGTAPYSYSWSNGIIVEDPNGMVPGNYQVTITDINECIDTSQIILPSSLATSITSQNTPSQTVCQNGNFSPIDIIANGGTLSYQWYSNTFPTFTGAVAISGANSSNYIPDASVAGTNYYFCLVTGGCGSDTSLPSGPFIVNPLLSPSVSIIASSDSICSGNTVVFTATPTNGGSNPSYQWQINGSNAGGNSDSLITTGLNNGDVINLIMTSSENCITNSSAASNNITMNVSSLTAIASENLLAQTICLNDTLLPLSINAVGSNLTYQWFANSSPTYSGATSISGGTNSNYQSASSNPGTLYYYCVVSGVCGIDTSSISGAQIINNLNQPTVNITASDSVICSGTTISFSSNVINGGSNPNYQWTLNGTIISGATNPTFSDSNFSNSDLVELIVNPGAGACLIGGSVNSNIITINVTSTPTLAISNTGPYCEGSTIALNSSSNGVVSWVGPNGFSSTLSNPSLPNSVLAMSGIYVATATSGTCTVSDSNTVIVNLSPISNAGNNQMLTCQNNSVTLSGSSAQYPSGSIFCSVTTTVIDVINPITGKTWMDRNLGASQVATSSTDNLAYGDLYQWGRRSDGHQCRNSSTTNTLSSSDQPANSDFILSPNAPNDWRSPQNSNLWQGANGINNPCPSGYRIPTESEFDLERLSWSNQNNIGAYSSNLKLVSSGSREHNNGIIFNVNTWGDYHTSTISGTDIRRMVFSNSSAFALTSNRAAGAAIRCIKDFNQAFGTFNWTGPGIISGVNTSNPVVNQVGVYTLTVTDPATNCTSNDTVLVTGNLTTPTLTSDTNQSLTCTINSVTLNSFSLDTGIVYNWTPGGSTPNSPSTTVTAPGNYTITVTYTATGCSTSSLVVVNAVGSFPDVNAGNDQALDCSTSTVTLSGSTTTPNTTVSWNPAGSNQFSLNTDVNAPGIYILTVTDTTNNCSSSDTAQVVFNGGACDELEFYNGITPNGDGKNDIFFITNIENFPINSFAVFNRYGAKLWEAQNYNNTNVVFKGIDIDGNELPPGTYYYVLEYQGKTAKGWLELLR